MQETRSETILITLENFEYGGTTTQLISLINNRNFKKKFFYIVTNKNNKGLKQIYKSCKKNNFKIIYFTSLNTIFFDNIFLKSIYLFLRPIFFFLSIIQMLIIIKNIKFSALLANCGGFGNFRTEIASIIAAKILRKNNLFLLIHHCYNKPILWSPIIEIINLFIGIFVDGIIFVSRATKASINKNSKLLSYSKKKTKVIHNGIEIKNYKRKKLKIFSKKKNIYIIGMLARLENYKGQIDLIKGFKNLSEKNKKFFKIFLIGNGSLKEINRLNKILKVYKIKKYVKRINYINENSYTIIKNFDIFCSLTKDFEGFGYSIAEALYCSTPVISTNVGGVTEYLNNKNSTLIKPGDIKSITFFLNNFLIKRENFKKKSIIGKRLIVEKFNSDIMSLKYKNYLKNKMTVIKK